MISLREHAVFLDFDGTLTEIAPRPSLVRLAPDALAILRSVFELTDGALAIVTGRSLAEIDFFLKPFNSCVAAVHGASIRYPDGSLWHYGLLHEIFPRLLKKAQKALGKHDGIIIENKGMAIAIHFRARPELGPLCRAVARHIANSNPRLICQAGKMVIEIVPSDVGKGAAIRNLLQVPPFFGKRPLFAGDDLTDECGFDAVNAKGGISIKIGGGETRAAYKLDDPGSLRQWLGVHL
ncbi:MAG: trehalose-phosphatase, partial [Hyphomicrobium sp.]